MKTLEYIFANASLIQRSPLPFMQIRINGIFIWSCQKNVVPLHREPAPRVSDISGWGSRHI